MRKIDSLSIVMTALFLAGCVSSQSGQVYQRGHAQQAQRTEMGTVEHVKFVKVEGTKSGAGAIGGAVVGGILGNQVGGGSGKKLATLGGALAGGAGGAAAEEKITSYDGIELTVKLDSGSLITVVQEADVIFSVGDRVRVLTSGDGTVRIQQ